MNEKKKENQEKGGSKGRRDDVDREVWEDGCGRCGWRRRKDKGWRQIKSGKGAMSWREEEKVEVSEGGLDVKSCE